ncbi:MAG: hypothetical protein AUJ04_07105 [Acidobacteria bacterium 13_1_40CM_3_55_6]|nr:MAG: hypothetical protein AUJ04_07105 [Acidobacteria bacterium 13_1_40CM_3_55_6]
MAESVQEEAVVQALQVEHGETPTLIFTAEHLAAELLRSGRPKDHLRVNDLIRFKHVDMETFREIVRRNGLDAKWKQFVSRYELEE